jgi:hypothetical protein
MEFELACDRLCDDIAQLLLDSKPPMPGAAYAAALATRSIAAALHRAAGRPDDPLWSKAIASIEYFLERCRLSSPAQRSPAMRELRGFLEENADLRRGAYRRTVTAA